MAGRTCTDHGHAGVRKVHISGVGASASYAKAEVYELIAKHLPFRALSDILQVFQRRLVMKRIMYLKVAKQYAAAFLLAAPVILLGQLADIPIKAGLWETHVSVNHGPPIAGQSCFTSGTTLADYLTATNKGAAGTQCSVTSKTQTAHGIAYDNTCKGQNLSSNGHIAFEMTDPEHLSGTSHTTVTGSMGGRPINMAIDKAFNGKFLSSDCGTVKPLVVPSASSK